MVFSKLGNAPVSNRGSDAWNLRCLRLPEHGVKSYDEFSIVHQVMKYLAEADTWQLPVITNAQQVSTRYKMLHKVSKCRGINHGSFVN